MRHPVPRNERLTVNVGLRSLCGGQDEETRELVPLSRFHMTMLRALESVGGAEVDRQGRVFGGSLRGQQLPGAPSDWLTLVTGGYVCGSPRAPRLVLSDHGESVLGRERARSAREVA